MCDDILCAIEILARESGYEFSIFANQYQIVYNDCIIKLSPNELSRLVADSID